MFGEYRHGERQQALHRLDEERIEAMPQHESASDPARPDDAGPGSPYGPGAVSPDDVNPVDGQSLGLPHRDAWLVVDGMSTPVPFEESVGQTHAYSGDPMPPPHEAFDLDSD